MIKFKDFTLTYEGAYKPSLKNINLDIKDGEFVLLTGLSGCGKTSLLRVINGLYKEVFECESEGEFEIDVCSNDDIHQFVGSVLQDSKSGFLFTELKSECIFPSLCVLRKKDEILEEWGVLKGSNKELFSNENSLHLSSGQSQLLSILSQVMKKAKIIVMDEPSANLDLNEIYNLQGYLLKLKEEGYTIIIAEHRVHFFEHLADRIVYLEDGEIKKQDIDYKVRKNKFEFSEHKKQQMHSSRLDLLNIDVSYGNKCILKDVFGSVYSNQVTCIVGRNGTGKSTLAKVICGLLKSKDKIIAINQRKLNDKQLIQESYYCMQDAYKQMITTSLIEELQLQDQSIEKSDALELLALVDLKEYATMNPARLSGGQVQRLSILLAYISSSKIVVLDEPTSGQDFKHLLQVVSLIEKMKKQNRFVFVISHDMEFLSIVMDAYIFIDPYGHACFKKVTRQDQFDEMMSKLKDVRSFSDIKVVEQVNHSKINPLVNVAVFFAVVNAIFIYPYNVSSIYLLALTLSVLAVNLNFKLMIKALISYSLVYALKGYLPISIQVVIEIFVLRGICANYAGRNIVRSSSLTKIIEAFQKAKLSDYILIPLICMLRIFPTFKYDVGVCFMSLKTRHLINSRNPVTIWNYMIVPLIHALIRTAENLASGITTKGLKINKQRTMITDVRFQFFDAFVLIVFFTIYTILILGGIT